MRSLISGLTKMRREYGPLESLRAWLKEKIYGEESEPDPEYRHFCHHIHDEQGNLTIITRKIKLEER